MTTVSTTGVSTALDWAIVALAIVTAIVGIGAIVNAVRVNKQKHRESVPASDLRAVG
jgi:hypothetical protein